MGGGTSKGKINPPVPAPRLEAESSEVGNSSNNSNAEAGIFNDSPTPSSTNGDRKNRADEKNYIRREKAKHTIKFCGNDMPGGDGKSVRVVLPTNEAKSADVLALLKTSLKDFFVFSDDPAKIDIVMKAMVPETFSVGEFLMVEGDPGTCLHIVESGKLEVTINGEFIRNMERGAIVGELALLYDAPRSATVKCMSDVKAWSLARDVFKSIQAASASAEHAQRARWLLGTDSLAGLSPVDLSRLMNVMQDCTYEGGRELFQEGVASMKCCMVIKGKIGIYSSNDPTGVSPQQLDKMHCIVRPSALQTGLSERFPAPLLVGSLPERSASEPDVAFEKTPVGSSRKFGSGISSYYITEVGPGCLLGFGSLRGKGGLSDAWVWKPGEGGVSTHLAVVKGLSCECLEFTLDVFERLFSVVEDALVLRRQGTTKVNRPSIINALRTFDQTKFVVQHCLGCGSFGSVTYAKYEDEKYALKTLGKAHLLDTGQLKHVLDERKLLSQMKCPFILRLYGTYQTPHKVVFVTEVLECGDLWGAIHEEDDHIERRGLPPPLAVFYTACLVVALAYIHEKGIAYRDLKPENIMIDSNGYLRIIDFGFAKVIPYVETRSSGVVEIHSKSYTLCGTPEYLAPEFVCNQGHDASVDLWALGVVIYEMFLSVTPFAARRPDNVTELFTNIANTKKNGLNLNASLDTQAGGETARSLITELLKHEPAERIGIRQGSTRYILDHDFFDTIDIASLSKCNMTAPWKPPKKVDFDDDIDDIPTIRPYHGNQKLFEMF
jgi:serine/threonine protein kinase